MKDSSPRDAETRNVDVEEYHKPSYLPPLVPPDGGWGWAVVFGTCLVTFVNGSIVYGFGIVYVYLVQTGYSNAAVAAIPAIMNGLTNLLAPLATGLTRFYSYRRLTIIGNLFISIGLLLCSFYNNIVWFYFSYGVILGIGNALAGPQGFLLSQQYFHKKRVAANGMSMTGQSIGFMILPVCLNYFIKEFSYQGAFMIWSGLTLHGIIGALLFQPVSWHMKHQTTIPLQDINYYPKEGQGTREVNGQAIDGSTYHDDREEESDYNSDSSHCSQISRESKQSKPMTQTSNFISHDPSESKQRESVEEDENLTEKRKLQWERRERERTITLLSSASNVFDAVEAFESNISVYDKNALPNGTNVEDRHEKKETKPKDYILFCGITFPKLKNMINFKLIKHPAFIVSSVASVINRIVYMCFVTYLPSIANDLNVGEYAPYLFSCIALFEFLAKIIMSLISDRGWMERRFYLILASSIASIAVCSITFATGFLSLALSCSLYGLCVGTCMSVGPVLLVEYLGLTLLPYSYGLLLFMNGIAGLCMFTLTGYLNDLVGNYIVTYWVIGLLVLIPATLWSLINYFLRGHKSETEAIEDTLLKR